MIEKSAPRSCQMASKVSLPSDGVDTYVPRQPHALCVDHSHLSLDLIIWSRLPSRDWTKYPLWRISHFLQFLIQNHQQYLVVLHHQAIVGSLSLNPTDLSLVDNLVVINHFIVLETYGEFCPFDPSLHLCSFGPSSGMPLCRSSLMTSPSHPLRW
jgi:hypothetical protein